MNEMRRACEASSHAAQSAIHRHEIVLNAASAAGLFLLRHGGDARAAVGDVQAHMQSATHLASLAWWTRVAVLLVKIQEEEAPLAAASGE